MHDSQRSAAGSVGRCVASMNYACNHTMKSCAGYFWSIDSRVADMTDAERAKLFGDRKKLGDNRVKVAKLCPDTLKVLEKFPSQRAASKAVGVSPPAINMALNLKDVKGGPLAAGGFYWRKIS